MKNLFSRVGYHYIPVSDIDKSIRWYTDHLGLKLISKFTDRGSNVAVLHYPHKNAIASLLIETSDQNPLEIMRNGEAFPIAALNCDDIEYTHHQLKEKGLNIGEIITLGNGEAKYFYFRDNEGNLLEAAWSIWDPKDEIKDEWQAEDANNLSLS
ncbi:VOC family protein [Bacillus sp. V2I10]|uniref:VOC family protein n=1 Tax=Bacillus sp. V2I10 TaxID=3042276 RepID=UPI00277F6242|nr:VOC family protein [Bacillus sp. V2I10]MDQ0859093.1 catechol 2,3-dioxygenase-like lactoylglutathione lyase family enzyme [Bacillus sp. V2I10]